jgi:hypothetical protein
MEEEDDHGAAAVALGNKGGDELGARGAGKAYENKSLLCDTTSGEEW